MRLNFGRNTDDYPLNLNYDVFIPDSSSPWWEDTHCCFHSRSMWDTLRLPSMSSINFDGGINGFSAYQQIMYQSHSVLAGNEINFVNNFYSHPDYLYSGKPWWHYFCVSENASYSHFYLKIILPNISKWNAKFITGKIFHSYLKLSFLLHFKGLS